MEHFLFPAHVTMVLPSLDAHMVKTYRNMNAFTLYTMKGKSTQLDKEDRSFLFFTNPKDKLKRAFGEVF